MIPHLVNISFETKNKLSIRAAWILEFITKDSLDNIIPYINHITSQMDKLKFDSSKRPIAKVCDLIVEDFYKNKDTLILLNNKNINDIISCCFNWMLGQEKVAVEAYSMNILYLIGKNQKWIHKELKHILIDNMNEKSCGYKSRGKKIIKWIDN